MRMAASATLESDKPDPAEAFRRAIDVVGSQTAMAKLIGMTQGAISRRVKKGKPCPGGEGEVLKVEAATQISRTQLRPDIYPPEQPTLAAATVPLDAQR